MFSYPWEPQLLWAPVTEHRLLRLSESYPVGLNTSLEEPHLELLGSGNPSSSFEFPGPILELTSAVINLWVTSACFFCSFDLPIFIKSIPCFKSPLCNMVWVLFFWLDTIGYRDLTKTCLLLHPPPFDMRRLFQLVFQSRFLCHIWYSLPLPQERSALFSNWLA